MTRALLTEFAFFLIPFAIFFIYLLLRQRNPLTFSAWEKSIPILVLVGGGLVVASLLYTGFTAERSMGTYTPPSLQDGQVAPGRFD